MSVRERHITPGTEGTPRLFAPYPRLFPEESLGLLTALHSPEPSFAQLRAMYTSAQAAHVREAIQANAPQPRRYGIQPPSSYEALFDAAGREPTREQQIRAALIYGNYHIAEKYAQSFYRSMLAQGIGVSLDECLDEALAVGIPTAIDKFPGGNAQGFAAYMEQVVTRQLIGWYKHERLRTQTPVRKAQRGERMQSTQALQETTPSLFASGVVYSTQRQETDPEQAASLAETFNEVKMALQSRYNTPQTHQYIDIFNASVQGATIHELAARYGRTPAAVQSVLRRARSAIEDLRPAELQGAKRAQTLRERKPRQTWRKQTPPTGNEAQTTRRVPRP